MRTVDAWKALLRGALRDAQRERNGDRVSALRETLAAIDNAEAPDVALAPAGRSEAFAGAVDGAGAGEILRRVLTPAEVAGIIERELAERRAWADSYAALGRSDDAERLRGQAEFLASLAFDPTSGK